jgi:hypothetical protein
MTLRGLDDAALLAAVTSIAPPFDAATERELIALAYGHRSKAVNKAALGVVTRHVKDAAAIKSAFKSRLAGMSFHLVDPKLRALARKDRGQIASALTAYGVSSYGLAFEEDPEFTRDFAPKLLRAKTNELYLTEWEQARTKNYSTVQTLELHTIPDVLFDGRHLRPSHVDVLHFITTACAFAGRERPAQLTAIKRSRGDGSGGARPWPRWIHHRREQTHVAT